MSLENLLLSWYPSQRGTIHIELTGDGPTQVAAPTHTLKLTKNMIAEIPSGMERLVNLTHLDVSENHIVELPPSICLLFKLKTLDANDNRLLTLPDAIGNLVAYASPPIPSFRERAYFLHYYCQA